MRVEDVDNKLPEVPYPTMSMTGVFIKQEAIKAVRSGKRKAKPSEKVRREGGNPFRKFYFKKKGNVYESERTFQHIRFYERNGKIVRSLRCITCNVFVREGEKHCMKCCELLGIKHVVNSTSKVSKPQCKVCKVFIKQGKFCRKCVKAKPVKTIAAKEKVAKEKVAKEKVAKEKVVKEKAPKEKVNKGKSPEKTQPSINKIDTTKKPLIKTAIEGISKKVNSLKKRRYPLSKKMAKKPNKPPHNIRCVTCKALYVREKGARCKNCQLKLTSETIDDQKYSFVNVNDLKESLDVDAEKSHLSTLDFIEIDDDRDLISEPKDALASTSGAPVENIVGIVDLDCDEVTEDEASYYVSMSDITRMLRE